MATKNDDCIRKENAAAAGIGASSGSGAGQAASLATSQSSVAFGESATAKAEDKDSANKPTGKNISEYMDSFSEAVEKAAQVSAMQGVTDSINAVDCGDVVYQFMMDNVPGFSDAMSLLNSGIGLMNGISTGVSISNLVSSPDFMKKVCDVLAKFYGTVDAYIEVFTKGAFVLFKKLDALLEKLEDTLINLTEAVKKCILDVLRDIARKLEVSLNLALNIDWDALTRLMQDCPCMTKVVAYMTGCMKDDEGRDITKNAVMVIECIREKFPYLNPVNLTVGMNKLIKKYITKYIELVFEFIESWIEYVYNFLIKPFRSFIKKYARMLTKKINVNGLIKSVGAFECFFVYTTEYDNGKEYYGMSIVDMINSFRQWINCFAHVCPDFAEKVKNRSKEIYKDLRLDDKYWRNAYAMDIYMMCIAAKVDSTRPRDSMLRSMYQESPIDIIMSWFRNSKNKRTKNAEEEAGEDVGPTEDEIEKYRQENNGEYPPDAQSPLVDAVTFTDGPETENEVNQGTEPIDQRSEKAIITILENLAAGGDSYYTEKAYQLVRLMNSYATSSDYVDAASDTLANIERVDTGFNDKGGAIRQADGRPDLVYDDSDIPATYAPKNDYDAERISKIDSIAVYSMKRPEGMGREDFYARMYKYGTA